MLKDLSKVHLDSADWLEDLFDHANDLIQIVHVDGALLCVNKAWSTLLGYDKEDLEGKSIYDFIEEADRNRYREYRNQIVAGVILDQPIVFGLQTKTGQIIRVEGGVSVKRSNERPLYTRGIFRDITVRLQNEAQLQRLNQELQEREQNLQQLLLQAPDAVIVIDKESRIRFWNPKAEALFGWRKEEVLHQHLASMIIPPKYREAHNNGMKRYLATGVAHVLNRTIEITALNKTGQEFYISLTIAPTLQAGEAAFIAFIRDITEQKQNQLELERKTKQLEQSNAHLEDFAHAASHDLKEPLRKIRTFSDRLKNSLESRLSEAEMSMFERIEASGERMQQLVDDLLEFSHVSENPRELEAINLNEKIQKVLADLELAIEEKDAQVIVSSLPTIQGNRRQLQQLFHNLISNALKYSKQGVPPVIHIRSRLIVGQEAPIHLPEEQKIQSFHLIEVSDNGIGFEPQYAEKIFEMFQRLHGKSEYSGTGVGLAIARKVVDNHGGYMWAESKQEEGATFSVLLPEIGAL